MEGRFRSFPNGVTIKPKRTPRTKVAVEATSSFLAPLFIRAQSWVVKPKVIARIGPMSGETSIDATTITAELVASPPPAMIAAPIRKHQKLKSRLFPVFDFRMVKVKFGDLNGEKRKMETGCSSFCPPEGGG